MKISLLRLKEDFDEIFFQSLALYLQQRYQFSSQGTNPNLLNNIHFIVNDRLNVIYPSHIDRDDLQALTAEFVFNKQPVKHILQKLFVTYSVRKPFERVLSSGSFDIALPENTMKNAVFIPGNHSHRIIDLDENISTVFSKVNSQVELTVTDAKIRLDYPFLKAPKVLAYDFEQGWYDEERVIGLPLNRLASYQQRSNIISQCQVQLNRLYSQTKNYDSTHRYKTCLLAELASMLSEDLFSKDIKQKVQSTAEHLLALVDEQALPNLCVVMSHGDFQPANILCSTNNFWMIDWEYAQKRTAFFDALVFELQSRYLSGFSVKLSVLMENLLAGSHYFSWCGETLTWENRAYIYIFIVEEIVIKLKEAIINDGSNLQDVHLLIDAIQPLFSAQFKVEESP